MVVTIDRDACTGHGRCYTMAPAVFGCDDDGYGYVLADQLAPELEPAAHQAVANCPERAIHLEG